MVRGSRFSSARGAIVTFWRCPLCHPDVAGRHVFMHVVKTPLKDVGAQFMMVCQRHLSLMISEGRWGFVVSVSTGDPRAYVEQGA